MKKLIIALLLLAGPALAGDVKLKWDVAQGATGYKLYMVSGVTSITMVNWDNAEVKDVGNVTEYTWVGAPDSGMTLWRVSAYNAKHEAINYGAGVWQNLDWAPPKTPGGLGVE